MSYLVCPIEPRNERSMRRTKFIVGKCIIERTSQQLRIGQIVEVEIHHRWDSEETGIGHQSV